MVELKKSRRKITTKVLPELSKTEYRVAELVARGLSEKEIAGELFVSRDTIHTHTYNIRKKWSARCAVDVAREFILSLDNPKAFFAALIFIALQSHIILTNPDMDLRRPVRTGTRVIKTAKKTKE